MSDVLSEVFEAGQHPAGNGFLTFGTDRRLMVRFFTMPVLQPYQSAASGRPVYVGTDMIEVRQPGERDAVVRPAHIGDQHRFRQHWEAFQANREQVQDGIPLANLFPAEPEGLNSMVTQMLAPERRLERMSDWGASANSARPLRSA